MQGVKPKPGQKIVPPTTPPSTPKAPTSTVAGKSSVLATPVGFRKVRIKESRQQTASEADPLLWKVGEDYGMPKLYIVRVVKFLALLHGVTFVDLQSSIGCCG